MFFGVSTIIFGNSVDISKNEINCIKNSGFDFIEISSFHCVSPEILDYIKSTGMKISSIHSNFSQTDISSLDEALRTASIEIIKSNILTAKRLEADTVVVHPGGWKEDKSILDAKISNAVRSFIEIADFANDNNVKIAIENLPPGFMCDSIKELQCVLDDVRKVVCRKESIGICLDTGHANLSSMVHEYISGFGKDIFSMHLHDNNGDIGGNRFKAEDDMHNIPGSGDIDWDGFFKKIKVNGYGHGLILELIDAQGIEKNIGKILTKAKEFLDRL